VFFSRSRALNDESSWHNEISTGRVIEYDANCKAFDSGASKIRRALVDINTMGRAAPTKELGDNIPPPCKGAGAGGQPVKA